MSDPLLATLALVPLIGAGLWFIERWIERRTGELAVTAFSNAWQAGVLATLVVAALGRHHLGLQADGPWVDQILMGGLSILLTVRVLQLVRGLGSARQGEAERPRPGWPFFVLPLLVYVAILPWAAGARLPDGDEPYYLLIAHSLVHDLDTDLTNNYAERHSLLFTSRALEPEWADPVRPDGRRYSRHSFLLPLILAPGYALAGKWGAMLTMTAMTAAVAWLAFALAYRYWDAADHRSIVAAWALLSLTPPLLLYSHQFWVEVPAALLVLVALNRILSLPETTTSRTRSWILLAVVLLLLPLLKLRLVLLSLPLALLAWWRGGGSRRGLIWLGVTAGAAIGGLMLFNQMVFGSPFKDHTLAQLLTIQSRAPQDYLRGLTGLFFDCAFGLVAGNPLWLLLVPGLAVLLRRRPPFLTDLAILAVPYLAVVTPRLEWFGAWSPPFRFGVVLLPMLALLLVPLLSDRRAAGAQGVIVALFFLTAGLSILWIVVPGWTYNLAVGTNHLLDHLAIRWAADAARFLPSMVRLRTATWLAPLVLSAFVLVAWRFPGRRSSVAAGWAVSLLLLLLAALPLAATRMPTHLVEIEDRQVAKRGGELYPAPWEPFRPRYRGGWLLRPGDSVALPVVAAGSTASIDLELLRGGRAAVDVELVARLGERLLGAWVLDTTRGWQTLKLEAVPWSEGASLEIAIRTSEAQASEVRVILDRARLRWP